MLLRNRHYTTERFRYSDEFIFLTKMLSSIFVMEVCKLRFRLIYLRFIVCPAVFQGFFLLKSSLIALLIKWLLYRSHMISLATVSIRCLETYDHSPWPFRTVVILCRRKCSDICYNGHWWLLAHQQNLHPPHVELESEYTSTNICWDSNTTYGTGSWNPFPCETRTCLFYIVSIMGADVLGTQGAKASAAMIFTISWTESIRSPHVQG